jgi:ubiquinone/menaquinone biosynthesis C-methylase UbiE
MERIERAVKSLFNTFRLDLAKSRKVTGPVLPVPSKEIFQLTERSFANSFPISPRCGMSQQEIEEQIKRYVWFYPLEFGGKLVDPDPERAQRVRARQRRRYSHIFPAVLSVAGGSLAGNTVLDIACNAGFWSIQARRAGADAVLGVDASAQNVEQARFVARLAGLDGLEYRVMNTYDLSKEAPGEFDISFFFGILYHLEEPVAALERLYQVTRKFAVIDTALVDMNIPLLRIQADDVSFYHTQSHANRLAFIPSEGAVLLMLKSVGFRDVFRVQNATNNLPKEYLNGKWGTFIAVK